MQKKCLKLQKKTYSKIDDFPNKEYIENTFNNEAYGVMDYVELTLERVNKILSKIGNMK
jgi:hypothetical protein